MSMCDHESLELLIEPAVRVRELASALRGQKPWPLMLCRPVVAGRRPAAQHAKETQPSWFSFVGEEELLGGVLALEGGVVVAGEGVEDGGRGVEGCVPRLDDGVRVVVERGGFLLGVTDSADETTTSVVMNVVSAGTRLGTPSPLFAGTTLGARSPERGGLATMPRPTPAGMSTAQAQATISGGRRRCARVVRSDKESSSHRDSVPARERWGARCEVRVGEVLRQCRFPGA
ncbi:hypothetical protein SAMN04488564_12714 [Lentzea waywayandensis]|uniref:Uncharacterized protein n=1 Tax=Lentzea waywayandensis TaxID=84724 RepID=A0A1I6FJL5_9PSEU|nr:hypothetical protein SAMN04488564_12714 [Lentzea waywayandensis]